MTGGLTLVGDVLVPLGAILTLVTGVGTVHWLKGKRRLALIAPLSIVSVIGIIGITRVAKPDSPWARWRYDADRMVQANARFGGSVVAAERGPGSTAGFATVVVGVLGGVPLGTVTSLAGGVLIGHALLASAGRPLSGRICLGLAAVLAAVETVLVVAGLPDPATLPGAAAALVVLVGAVVLHVHAGRSTAPTPR
ncbi:hypothetical protein [Pseudonocardia endophytica]|uniref:Uncharacterized protein n=1 Tax=Pseudonocardia endophytica TaxID=401976 RepID=A0A4R1I135_PSEEN|nr:hypothetical protein [Pseudonocardia endophytica]TCK26139.1 hypothetical protein EV378_1968 [Pseudonocardia endophytica]